MNRALSAARVTVAGLALALAACSDPGGEPPADASPDADLDAVDAPIDAVPIDAPPTELDGTWAVTWTCLENCPPLPAPAVTYSDRLTAAGGALHWHSVGCGDCVADHVGAARETCVDVPAIVTVLDDQRPYSICAIGPSTMELEVSARRIGGNPIYSTWRGVGRRL